MEELLNIKTERGEDTISKQVNFKFICPTCKITFAFCFNTSEKATEGEIEDWIGGQRRLFYYNHVLDCNGGGGNSSQA